MRTIFFVLSWIIVVVAHGQAGSLDSSFGNNGKVVINFSIARDEPTSLLNLPDGRTILNCSTEDFAMICLLPDGRPDKSFGERGFVQTNFETAEGPQSFSNINSLVLLPDGKILAGGWVSNRRSGDQDVIVARYLQSGRLDSSFGTYGRVITDGNTVNDMCIALVVQTDNKIVAAGQSDHLLLFRYTADGAVDSTFGDDGKVYVKLGGNENDYCLAASLQSDGKIVVATRIDYEYPFSLIRFDNKGKIDSAFGTNGITWDSRFRKGTLYAKAMIIQLDDRIILAGYAAFDRGQRNAVLARYLKNGQHDSTFGNDGFVVTNYQPGTQSGEYFYALAQQKDGKIIAAGCKADIYGTEDLLIGRYGINGIRDLSFGAAGFTVTDIGSPKEKIMSLGIKKDGDIIGGAAYNFYNAVVVGYNGDNMQRTITIPHVIPENKIKLYPNPVKNTLRIDGLSTTQKTMLRITDISGTTRMFATANTVTYSWNISLLPKGNYVLHVQTGNTVVSKKFVKE